HIGGLLVRAAERQRQAFLLERELLTRREELRRLNDSLRNAYALLERANRELADARDEAEEARRLKNQFAATISHELRTPLNLILGFTEVMHTAPESYGHSDLPPDLRGDIREVYQNTRHLLDLVDDVLDLSRIEQVRLALVPEESDLLELIREAAATVAGLFRGKPVQLAVDLPPELPRCVLDRTRIRQVLINLLTNAARFTEEGEVRVQAVYDDARREVVVSVSDTGPGIPEAERERVFQPFHQASTSLYRHKGGSGLGLAICRTFVQMHGGRIWVQSQEGQGTRFSFALPVRAIPPSTPSDWRPADPADPAPESIVAVDPSGAMSRLLERALPHFQVHNAQDLTEVGSAIARHHPRAVIAFTDGDTEAALDRLLEAAPWPGLPLLGCRMRARRPLDSFPNVRAVLTKPARQGVVLDALAFLGYSGTLVLADDDEGMTRLMRRALSRSRPALRVLAAHDGEQALELIRAHRPDAVLLDLAMPGQDGLSVLQTMADEGLDSIPVVVLTAMDLKGTDGNVAADQLALASCAGISELELVRYLEALATAARPRYVGEAKLPA
ncbi:MAG: ATP-binding protein, partial [Anaerolineae bacterium]